MIKIVTIKSNTAESLAQSCEKHQNQSNLISKGSHIVYDSLERMYVAFLYFAIDPTQVNEAPIITAPIETSNKPFKPSKSLIEKWKKQPVSQKTKNMLKAKHKLTKQELEGIKTQYDAYVFTNNLKEENI